MHPSATQQRFLAIVTVVALAFGIHSQGMAQKPGVKKPGKTTGKKPPVKPPKPAGPLFKPSDVVATIDGHPITRRELTAFWLQVDSTTAKQVGEYKAAFAQSRPGPTPAQPTEAQVFAFLYTPKPGEATPRYANILSSLITYRLVALEAERKGVKVTPKEAEAYGHQVFDDVRRQQGLKESDAELIKMFKLPRQAFYDDMAFRLRAERLLAADIARQNGHPIGPDDWMDIRELFAAASISTNPDETEAEFASARKRIEEWLREMREGKSMEQAALEHNEDITRAAGGLRGPALRGTGTPALEAQIARLKPGELSLPLRARGGWYVFRVERRGSQITEEERQKAWKQIVAVKLPLYLLTLRRNANVISLYNLPAATPPNVQGLNPSP